jgi:hypothetical protein
MISYAREKRHGKRIIFTGPVLEVPTTPARTPVTQLTTQSSTAARNMQWSAFMMTLAT